LATVPGPKVFMNDSWMIVVGLGACALDESTAGRMPRAMASSSS
jgi:hypothetical protein